MTKVTPFRKSEIALSRALQWKAELSLRQTSGAFGQSTTTDANSSAEMRYTAPSMPWLRSAASTAPRS